MSLLLSLSDLFMTSAKALLTEARLRDCLMEVLLVTGLVFGLLDLTVSTWPGMLKRVTGYNRGLDRVRSSRVVGYG